MGFGIIFPSHAECLQCERVLHDIFCSRHCITCLIVVMRTYRQITALEHSVAFWQQYLRKYRFRHGSTNTNLQKCDCLLDMYVTFKTHVLAYSVLRNVTNGSITDTFSFVSVWLFETNSFVNSLLYLVLFSSVRQNFIQMIYETFM